MSSESAHQPYRPLEGPPVDFNAMSAADIVTLAVASETIELEGNTELAAGTPWHTRLSLFAQIEEHYITDMYASDPQRFKEISLAAINSVAPLERGWAASSTICIVRLTRLDHDLGVACWDQLMRDENREVRQEALEMLENFLGDFGGDNALDLYGKMGGMYDLATLDVSSLIEFTGLTPADAYSLLESYAYAENGQHIHYIGRAALDRLIATIPPDSGAA